MSAQILKAIELQENTEQLKAQLRAELAECVKANATGKNHVLEFMLRHEIWHIAELDYPLREQFKQELEEKELVTGTIRTYLRAYDRIKQHSVQQQIRVFIIGKQTAPSYENEIFFLPYHPDPQIAERYINATNKEDLVWDFQRQAPLQLKHQVFDILNYAVKADASAETIRLNLLGLHELYDFCTEEGSADIEQLEIEQIQRFLERESARINKECRLRSLNFCRKALFMIADEINWNAHVWYMERIHLQPERVDLASPVTALSFLEVTHQKNRELLKQYMRYGLGVTNLSINALRTEMNYVRGFLADLEQSESENVCTVTAEQMDAYFQKERMRPVQAETFNKRVMSILHFFSFLRARQYIDRIPFDEEYYLKKTMACHHDRSVEEATVNEILGKLYAFPEDLRLMFLHLWGIGLRISEVCLLKGDAYYIQGQDAWIQVYQTKMRRYKRIPIPAALYELMKVYLRKYDIKADEYVFKNHKGGAYRSGTFRYRMLKYCEANNIQDGEYIFKSHDFRHTVATQFYDAGVPLQSIRDYLGHDYEEMTQQYVDYMPKRIEKASEEYFSQHSLASCLRKR